MTPPEASLKNYPFALRLEYLGTSVPEACQEAVELSQHLRCLIKVHINDVDLIVCGHIMTTDDVCAQWEYENKRLEHRRQTQAESYTEL